MYWINPRYAASVGESLTDYDDVVKLPATDEYHEKQGRSTGRYHLPAGADREPVYLKKYARLPWWMRLFAPLDAFPGPRELACLQQAQRLGVPVPEPVLAGADRHHACASFLALRELEGYAPLHRYIPEQFGRADRTVDLRHKRDLIARLADIARRMDAGNCYHRDLYLCHFFIRRDEQADGGFHLALIDFLRLKCSGRSRWQIKDLAQLLFASDLPGIGDRVRLRFFKLYLGANKLGPQARSLLRQVQRKASGYRRHNDKMAA